MSSKIESAVIVGAGNAGTQLAKALWSADVKILEVISQSQ